MNAPRVSITLALIWSAAVLLFAADQLPKVQAWIRTQAGVKA